MGRVKGKRRNGAFGEWRARNQRKGGSEPTKLARLAANRPTDQERKTRK